MSDQGGKREPKSWNYHSPVVLGIGCFRPATCGVQKNNEEGKSSNLCYGQMDGEGTIVEW